MARRSARSNPSASKSGDSSRAGRSSARSSGGSSGRARRSARARDEEDPQEELEEEAEEGLEEDAEDGDEGVDADDADEYSDADDDADDADADGNDDDDDEEDEEDEEDEDGGGNARASGRGGKPGRGKSGRGKSGGKGKAPADTRQPRERTPSEPVTPGKAIAMTVFLGLFGAGRFVMGYTGIGIAQIGLTVLALLGLLLPPSLLDIPQGFWFALPYLALVGNATLILHDILLLGSGLMKDARGRPILPPPPEGAVSKDRTRDRTYQMGLFGGMFGVARFYLGDMVRGGIHLGLTVVGLTLLLVSLPSWIGMRDYRVAGSLHYEETREPATGNPALIHHITLEVFPQETPLGEVMERRTQYAEASQAYFSSVAERRRQERLPLPYLPPAFLDADAMKEEDGTPIHPDEHVTILRGHDAASATATEARLRAERRKAENRVWRGFVEGRPDEEGRVGKSALQAVLDMYERPPLQLRRPYLGIAGAVLLFASVFLWALDLIALGGGTVKTAKGVELGFSQIHPRFNEKNREATRHVEIGVVMFVGAFFCFIATVYTGWPNAHGQPSLLEGVQIGFFVSLLLVLLFGGFGGYHLFAGERLQGEIRDEKLALMRQLDKHERDGRQGGSKKGAPPAPPRPVKGTKKSGGASGKSAPVARKAAPPAAKAPPSEEEGGEEDAPKKKAPRVRRRRRM